MAITPAAQMATSKPVASTPVDEFSPEASNPTGSSPVATGRTTAPSKSNQPTDPTKAVISLARIDYMARWWFKFEYSSVNKFHPAIMVRSGKTESLINGKIHTVKCDS